MTQPPSPAPLHTPTAHTPHCATKAMTQRLALSPGQAQLVWVATGAELRCLQGVVRLHSTSDEQRGLAPPPQLTRHGAWRSPLGTWVGVQADASQAVCLLSLPHPTGNGPDRTTEVADSQEKSRHGRVALWRLWVELKRRFVRPAQHAS